MRRFRIAVFAGDGIGPEVMEPCLTVLDAVVGRVGGFALDYERCEAGAGLYRSTGEALPPGAMASAEAADAILLAAMGIPDVRYPNGTEVQPHLDFRERFDLYAGLRPIRVLVGAPTPLADERARTIDCVLVRESTEGLFAARQLTRRSDDAVYDTQRISRGASERLFKLAFTLARSRKRSGRVPSVTCVDKANVLPSMAFFRSIFLECSAAFPDVEAKCAYVDATALRLVRAPWEFDVLVTENMFGDILSDLGAALMGGMGMAPSADIGDRHAVFQPCHGSAPDIAGREVANPTAMFLSAAMMLRWLADRHGVVRCATAADELTRAIEQVYAEGTLVPVEHGGTAGTRAVTAGVLEALGRPVARESLR